MKNKIPVRQLTMVALMVAFCAVCAQIAIPLPFSVVPLTLQTFAVMLAALLLGPRYAALAMVVYLLAGTVGLPIFSGGKAGLGVLLGPTGGFIWGFIPGALVMGWLAPKVITKTAIPRAIGGATAGLIIIYILGVAQFCLVTQTGLWAGFTVAALPFLPLEVVKILLAGTIACKIRQRGLATI